MKLLCYTEMVLEVIKMLSKPKFGWSELKIGDFISPVESVTDVPCDILKAYYDFFHFGQGIASFYNGGFQFDLILSYTMDPSTIYIVDNSGKVYIEKNWLNAEELIYDIKDNIDAWAEWFGKYSNNYKELILENVKKLETELEDYKKRKIKRIVR